MRGQGRGDRQAGNEAGYRGSSGGGARVPETPPGAHIPWEPLSVLGQAGRRSAGGC